MTVVVGTAGHIDHGKTALLRALTGIDADRLPEEQRRGMTIDVGYAHLALPDGGELDFVDVPGHDRLVGNMLVGAGEVDAALLVVAADDGSRPQTLEHLALLDALGLAHGLVVVTKADLVPPERLVEVEASVRRLLAPTGLAGAPIMAASAASGAGLDAVRAALVALAERVAAGGGGAAPPRLAIDRAFSVRGRGTVVTGSLRGGSLATGARLRLLPADRYVRVRELQVHGRRVAAAPVGRTALNLGGVELADVGRGDVLTTDPAIVATDRLLVAMTRPAPLEAGRRSAAWPPPDGAGARFHLATADVDATLGRAGRDRQELPDGRVLAVVRLAQPVAAAAGDRFLFRRPSPGTLVAGGVVLDSRPPRGVSRKRQTLDRVAALGAVPTDPANRLELHGAVAITGGAPMLAPDVAAAGRAAAVEAVRAWHVQRARDPGMPLPALRVGVARRLRREVTLDAEAAATAADGVIGTTVRAGALVREGDRLRLPSHQPVGQDPVLAAAMERLEAALVGSGPPPLAATAASVGCPPEGIRALERAGRIVVLEPDLAWAASSYRELAARALVMATRAPLTPASYRDATGTSRKFCLAVLEDLDRRGILRRTDAGHVPGPHAPRLPDPGTPTPS